MKKSIGYVILIALLIFALIFLWFKYDKTLRENKQNMTQLNEAKIQVEYELQNLSLSYDSLQTTNEAMQQQIELEKTKIDEMIKELKRTKRSSYNEISRYKSEVNSMKTLLQQYTNKIDSLNYLNQQLTAENIRIKEEVEEADQRIIELEEKQSEMEGIIDVAQTLEAMNIRIKSLKKNGWKTKRARRTRKIETNFILNKNATAKNGLLDLYVVITRPDGVVLGNLNGEMFDSGIGLKIYSATRQVHYGGEYLPVSIFYESDNKLTSGSYDIEIFTDGKSIGKSFFSLK